MLLRRVQTGIVRRRSLVSLELISHSLILALAYTIEFWRKDKTQQKYYETANAIGQKLEAGDILAEIEKKVPPGEDNGTMRWAIIKAKLALEAGGTAMAALPTRSIPPPPSRGESARHGQADPVPGYHPSSEQDLAFQRSLTHRPNDKHRPLISPSTVLIQSQFAAGEASDDHYDAKMNTSRTKKRRVASIIDLED